MSETLANLQRASAWLLLLFVIAVFGLAATAVHDFDIFWQLQSGRYMVETRAFLHHDVFSLAAAAPRHEHCWLHDLIVYGVWSLGGYAALSLFKGALIAATLAAVVAVARLRGASWAAILPLAPVLFLLTWSGWVERPQLWSFLCFSLFLLVIEWQRRAGGWRILWLAPIMLLWTNLHVGALLGVAVAAAYLAGQAAEYGLAAVVGRERNRQSALRAGGAALLVFAALFATPYAAWLWGTLVSQVGMVLPQPSGAAPQGAGGVASMHELTLLYNMDWRTTDAFADPAFSGVVVAALLLLVFGWRRLNLYDLLILFGVAKMGLSLHRHLPFFYLGCAALLPVYAETAVALLPRPGSTWLRRALAGGLVAIALFGMVYLGKGIWQVDGFFKTGLRAWHFPVEAAAFVRQERLPGNLYNTYDWGGYLMWELFPAYRVFWDGRQDSEEMFRLGLAVMRGDAGWEEILQRFEVNAIVTKTCTIDTGQHFPLLDQLREDPDWALVLASEASLVFVRRGAMEAGWLGRRELPKSRIDDTILSEAHLLTSVEPRRYMAWWEMANIYLQRRQYREAFPLLRKHLAYAPEGRHLPAAENYFRLLYPMMQQP